MTVGIVLAAGRSSRMGRPKAFLEVAPGTTFLGQLVKMAHEAGLTTVLVVGRSGDATLRAEVERAGAGFVPNPDAERGQLSSVLAGLDAAHSAQLEAIVVMPVDMPLISAGVLRRLLEAVSSSTAAIVRPVHRGRHGHPVVFRRAVFEELRQADPNEGARSIVRRDPARVLDVEVDDEGVAIDIDTPDDYARVFGGERGRS